MKKKLNYVGIRLSTNEGQKIPAQYGTLLAGFKADINQLRRKHEYTAYNIGNMDQTMCRFDMAPNYTNEERGAQDIRIVTSGGSKRGFTVALCATASG